MPVTTHIHHYTMVLARLGAAEREIGETQSQELYPDHCINNAHSDVTSYHGLFLLWVAGYTH